MTSARTAAVLLAALVPAVLTGCGSPAPATATCGVVVDGSSSAEVLAERTGRGIDRFVTDNVCGTVRVVVISANSAGEACTRSAVDLTADMRADPSNIEAWRAEYRDDQAPRVLALARELLACVAAAGTGTGTDVFGAFREFHRTLPAGVPGSAVQVVVASDMVDTVSIDMGALGGPPSADLVRSGADLLPDMAGWTVTSIGAGFGTVGAGTRASSAIQGYWLETITLKDATYEQLAG